MAMNLLKGDNVHRLYSKVMNYSLYFYELLTIKIMIDFNFLKIKEFYPYRTAIVTGICLEDKTISETVREFLSDNGYKMDNHICFTTENGLAFMYSDRCLYVGTKVTKRNW